MLVIPALDLRDGLCVRLVQGDMSSEIVYSDEPVQMARQWEEMGASYLHIVDLDGAFTGAPKNLEIVKDIVKNLSIPVEMGGGIRSYEAVKEVLDLGVDRVILGTAAILSRELVSKCVQDFGEKIAVALMVVTRWWR